MNLETTKSESARIMVIDDDESITQLISEIAEESGYQAHCVNHSDQVTKGYKTFKPDIIFLDLDLIDRDGIEVIQFLSIEECPARIVIMSGMDEVTRENSRQIGIQMNLNIVAALGKPFLCFPTASLCALIVISKLCDQYRIVLYRIYNPMHVVDSTRPISGQRVLQRFRFANSLKRSSLDVFD